ncbi:MAG: hypothetical protein ACI4RN_07090 [Oscillospiraceae bacterium]
MNDNSLKNLISFDKMSEEKQRDLSRRGGIASGKARRKKAAWQKAAIQMLRNMDYMENLNDEQYQDFMKWRKEQRRKNKGGKNNEN